jgi:hypothetical protein
MSRLIPPDTRLVAEWHDAGYDVHVNDNVFIVSFQNPPVVKHYRLRDEVYEFVGNLTAQHYKQDMIRLFNACFEYLETSPQERARFLQNAGLL